jgi:hypothetical protein
LQSTTDIKIVTSDFNRNQESQMYRSLTAVLLCIFTQAAAAQCAASVPIAQEAQQGAATAHKTQAASATAAAHTGGALIKTAAAGTHDDAPVARAAPPARAAEDDAHRRGGPAMLFAALALMSGIALRRFGANK